MANSIARRLEQLTGMFLVLVGCAFLILFAFVKITGRLSGEFRVSAFFLVMSSILVWIGCGFLKTKTDESKSEQPKPLNLSFTAPRVAAEVLAVIGCLLMFLHGMCVVAGISWPPNPLLYMLLVAPVVLGQIVLTVLRAGAFQIGVFPPEITDRWSADARRAMTFLLRVGWLGYIGILFAWPDAYYTLPMRWAPVIVAIACLLISVLYATQALMLHLELRRSR